MDDQTGEFRRRTVLAGTGTLAFVPLPLASGLQRQSNRPEGFVIEQGDRCIPFTPLTGSDPVEAFYNWNLGETDYSSAGTTGLQRQDTSILFLYRGPDGTLSLVIVHDAYEPNVASSRSGGGSATFHIAGLDADGQWVVRDDFYDSSTRYDVWQVDTEPQRIDWTWAGARSDGGAFGPLTEPVDIRINPSFNQAAELSGQHYVGRINDWQVLSGDRSTPDRTSLALDQPVRLRSGTCRGGQRETERDPDPGKIGVRVVPGRVNPRSRGRLPVDLYSTDGVSVEDLVPESLRAVPSGARPVAIHRRPGRDDVVRLFFSTPDLNLAGNGTATLEIVGETTNGRKVTGADQVRLTPNRSRDAGDDDDDRESDRERGDGDEESRENRDEDGRRERDDNRGDRGQDDRRDRGNGRGGRDDDDGEDLGDDGQRERGDEDEDDENDDVDANGNDDSDAEEENEEDEDDDENEEGEEEDEDDDENEEGEEEDEDDVEDEEGEDDDENEEGEEGDEDDREEDG